MSSTERELRAILIPLEKLQPPKKLRICSDNQAAITIVNKGSSRVPEPQRLVPKINVLRKQRQSHWVFEFVRGFNNPADEISREINKEAAYKKTKY